MIDGGEAKTRVPSQRTLVQRKCHTCKILLNYWLKLSGTPGLIQLVLKGLKLN